MYRQLGLGTVSGADGSRRYRSRVPRSRFSKERRLEPRITVGLLTDAAGVRLMVDAFEGNRAETRT